jgi:FecR protein
MKRALPVLLTFFCLLLINTATFAQTADDITSEAEDDASAGRVVRVSFVEGDVSFQRAGTSDWAAVIENLPLFAGDQIYAGPAARVELQLGRGSYIRLSENTALTITDMRDDAVQFELPAGIAFVRVEQLATAFQRFEVDTPNAALLLEQDGLYRINVRGDNDSEVIVRHGAAEVATNDGSFKVREGRRLLIDTSASGRLEVAYDTTQDDWDIWSTTRDATINSQYINAAPDYVAQYETTYSDFYGVSDLSSYGSWYDDPGYGYCWRPRVATGWAPYRQGQWVWTPRAGWTWISSEPWGWAPYHYGRWVFAPAYGWAWVPGYGRSTNRGDNYRWRAYYRWRPALVGFFDAPSPRGHYVGWYPLAPGQHWRRPDREQRRGSDHSHLQYPTTREGWQRPGRGPAIAPHDGRGVTLLPVEGFNRSDRSKTRPVAPDSDLSNWIKRGARPGLPEIKPLPVAIAPVMRDDRRNRIAIPANEIIRRPVVTRNRPSGSEATANPPRERRLITPRVPVMSNDEPVRREKRERSDDQRLKPPTVARPADGQNSNPSNESPRRAGEKGGKPQIMPVERGDAEDNRSERKARRGNETSTPPSPDNGSGNDSSGERHKRPAYTPQPQPADSASGDDARLRERKQRDEEQNRQRDEERVRQRDEERQRHVEEERARQREAEQNNQRDQERTRQQEERQRRNDEDRQRRTDEDRQRRNDEDRTRQQQEERQRQNEAERARQRNEERQREQAPREKPPAKNPAPNETNRQQKQERRAESEPRKKS